MTTYGKLGKDLYLLLAEYSNDKDVLNILSVNKMYNDCIFYQRIIKKRYVSLLRLKKSKESWKNFYVRMIYYLNVIKEEANVDYIHCPSFDPFKLFIEMQHGTINHLLSECIGESGNKALIDNALLNMKENKYSKYMMLGGIIKSGNLELYKEYENQSQHFYTDYLIINSHLSRNQEMANYLLNKAIEAAKIEIETILENQMKATAELGDIPLFEFYENQIKQRISTQELKFVYDNVFEYVLDSKSISMVKYFIENKFTFQIPDSEFDSIYFAMKPFIRTAHTDEELEIIKYIFNLLDSKYQNELFHFSVDLNFIDRDILSFFENFDT